MLRHLLLALLVLPGAGSALAADWKPAPAPLMTRWGKQITPEKQPWAEYPRPQLVRKNWLNLNGLWDYAITAKDAEKPAKWDGQILVPFCVESALGGVGKRVSKDQLLWYRRDLKVPAEWNNQRVMLRFDAVDWESTVFVNGQEVGSHKGGSDPFAFDITDHLKDGQGELVLRVWDPTDDGAQPRGKQVNNPEGIWYTPVTGIWQTVWLEPLNSLAHVVAARPVADLANNKVVINFEMGGAGKLTRMLTVIASDGGKEIARHTTPTAGNFAVELPIKNPQLWSPDSPHLYDLKFTIATEDGTQLDEATSYFAMRSISMGNDENGVPRMMLNGKPLFQYGPLDQGWWPDGLLTPPSDEAMKYDLDMLKKLGFNMLRKHIKVEPSRLYHHCDKIGLLVWQDMPSGMAKGRKQFVQPNAKSDGEFTDEEKAQFLAEHTRMIQHLRFFPCIVVWVPFNEGWGQHDTNDILKFTKKLDPSRLVNGPSGWTDRGYGDMKDMHNYPGPGMFPVMADRISVLGEFGGLGLPVKNRLWKDQGNWGYRTYKTHEDLRRAYQALMLKLHVLIGQGLAAAVYTQTTDVEVEVNGLMTYDREELKFDPAETAKWHAALFGPPPVVRTVIPTSENAAQSWKFTTSKPAEDWQAPDFDAAGWKEGPGGFGTKDTPGTVIRTEWNTPEIWLRRQVDLPKVPDGELFLRVHHDEDVTIFINGVLAGSATGYVTSYTELPLTAAGRKALKPGANVIAVHCKQTGGGQYVDVGLVELVPAKSGKPSR